MLETKVCPGFRLLVIGLLVWAFWFPSPRRFLGSLPGFFVSFKNCQVVFQHGRMYGILNLKERPQVAIFRSMSKSQLSSLFIIYNPCIFLHLKNPHFHGHRKHDVTAIPNVHCCRTNRTV